MIHLTLESGIPKRFPGVFRRTISPGTRKFFRLPVAGLPRLSVISVPKCGPAVCPAR